MTDLLDRIRTYKLEEIAAAKQARSLSVLERQVKDAPARRGFLSALEDRLRRGEYGLIAEVKMKSPSKGLIRADFDPRSIARAYEAGGAACLSVLTDTPSFGGSLQAMADARATVSLPVLRKDFMFDPYQVVEARAWGADCILIMLSAVTDQTAKELEDTAFELGMDVLVEVHDQEELRRAMGMRSRLVGINNRDLRTFDTTLDTSERLAPRITGDRVIVGESGLHDPADLARLSKAGINCFLVGESLMRADDIEAATRRLLER